MTKALAIIATLSMSIQASGAQAQPCEHFIGTYSCSTEDIEGLSRYSIKKNNKNQLVVIVNEEEEAPLGGFVSGAGTVQTKIPEDGIYYFGTASCLNGEFGNQKILIESYALQGPFQINNGIHHVGGKTLIDKFEDGPVKVTVSSHSLFASLNQDEILPRHKIDTDKILSEIGDWKDWSRSQGLELFQEKMTCKKVSQ